MQCEFEFNDDYCYDYDDDIGELPNLHGKKNKEGVREIGNKLTNLKKKVERDRMRIKRLNAIFG